MASRSGFIMPPEEAFLNVQRLYYSSYPEFLSVENEHSLSTLLCILSRPVLKMHTQEIRSREPLEGSGLTSI